MKEVCVPGLIDDIGEGRTASHEQSRSYRCHSVSESFESIYDPSVVCDGAHSGWSNGRSVSTMQLPTHSTEVGVPGQVDLKNITVYRSKQSVSRDPFRDPQR
jgi:hypothetical protein